VLRRYTGHPGASRISRISRISRVARATGPTGSYAARLLLVLSALVLGAVVLLEADLSVRPVRMRADRPHLASGSTPVGLFGEGEDTWCFVNDEFRSVPMGLPHLAADEPRMLRLPADGVPKRLACGNSARVVESRLVWLYPLAGQQWPPLLGALAAVVGAYAGWPLRRRRPVRFTRR